MTVIGSGRNGIRYQGNEGLIHDNVSDGNGQFGIYVVDGVDHQISGNSASDNAGTDVKILGSQLFRQRTYYVDASTGTDGHSAEEAQNPLTPWLTIQRALDEAGLGDTVIVGPGVYAGAESRRDGTATYPIVLRSSRPGGAVIQAGPAASGLLVTHDHHTVDGFVVTGSLNGIQMGPHEVGDGPVRGLVAINNVVHDNAAVGLKFTNAEGGQALHNVVYGNGGDGILYSSFNRNSTTAYTSRDAMILNNLVLGNGANGDGEYGITITSGEGHQVINNTVHGNLLGGVRLGTTNAVPVFSTVYNNIVTANPIGVKEPGGSSYTGVATLDFNNVHGNTQDYALSNAGLSVAGAGSVSQAPAYVDAAGGDFRLSRIDAGQASDSPRIDGGSASADSLGLAGRTAFTDKRADTGRVDLGYHGVLLKPSQGDVVVGGIHMSLTQAIDGDGFSLTARLSPGEDSDGLGLGTDYVEVGLGALLFTLPAAGFTRYTETSWTYGGSGASASGSFVAQPDGSVDISLTAGDLNLAFVEGPIAVQFRVGDDAGSATVPVRGSLVYP